VAKGSIETLRTGFRARVYVGKDPITGKQTYHRGETRRNRRDAEADRRPDLHTTVGTLLDRWMEIVDHELSTAETTAGARRPRVARGAGAV
jgi:hypothetical protein